VTVGVYDTEQVAVPAAVPGARLQDAVVGLKVPVEFVAKLTDPLGVVGVADVSVTVAVHVLAVLIVTDAGEHETVVVVECGGAGLAAIRKLPRLVA